MRHLDKIYGSDSAQREDQEKDYIRDPYARKNSKMKHQEFRTIKVGPVDLLKNG